MLGTGKQGWAEFISPPSLFDNTRLMRIETTAQPVQAKDQVLSVPSGFRLREFFS
jgi:hypothetical protein